MLTDTEVALLPLPSSFAQVGKIMAYASSEHYSRPPVVGRGHCAPSSFCAPFTLMSLSIL